MINLCTLRWKQNHLIKIIKRQIQKLSMQMFGKKAVFYRDALWAPISHDSRQTVPGHFHWPEEDWMANIKEFTWIERYIIVRKLDMAWDPTTNNLCTLHNHNGREVFEALSFLYPKTLDYSHWLSLFFLYKQIYSLKTKATTEGRKSSITFIINNYIVSRIGIIWSA